MVPEFTLTLSPGETLENLNVRINTDNTITIVPVITKAFKRGDFVVLKDGTLGIVMNFDRGIYQLQWRIDTHGHSINTHAVNPMQVRLATEKECEFMLDILYDENKYLDENSKTIKKRPRFRIGQTYYSVQIVDNHLEPVELTWEDDKNDIALNKKGLVFRSLEACEFFINSFNE